MQSTKPNRTHWLRAAESSSADRTPTIQVVETRWLPRFIYLALAALFFLLGAAGAFLPGLPATPFLLLTSYFLAKTSPRLNRALHRMVILGPILRDWEHHRGVRPVVKVQALIVVTLVLSMTLLFAPLTGTVKLVIAAVGLVGIGVILWLPALYRSECK